MRLIAAIVFLVHFSSPSFCQTSIREQDRLPCLERMSLSQFDSCVIFCSSILSHTDLMNIENCILCVKIRNSIFINNVDVDYSPYKEYDRIYEDNIETIVSKLDGKLSRGMGYYSERYKLDIGGSPHSNSYFCLEGNDTDSLHRDPPVKISIKPKK